MIQNKESLPKKRLLIPISALKRAPLQRDSQWMRVKVIKEAFQSARRMSAKESALIFHEAIQVRSEEAFQRPQALKKAASAPFPLQIPSENCLRMLLQDPYPLVALKLSQGSKAHKKLDFQSLRRGSVRI